jgi:hypothetical protein
VEAKIYGPKGDPDKIRDPERYTIILWEEVRDKGSNVGDPGPPLRTPKIPSGGHDLMKWKCYYV